MSEFIPVVFAFLRSPAGVIIAVVLVGLYITCAIEYFDDRS